MIIIIKEIFLLFVVVEMAKDSFFYLLDSFKTLKIYDQIYIWIPNFGFLHLGDIRKKKKRKM